MDGMCAVLANVGALRAVNPRSDLDLDLSWSSFTILQPH